MDNFVDWVLAFAVYSQALLSKDPPIAGDLLLFMETVARLPGPYMRGISGPMPINWGKLNQEVWALSTVNQTPLHSSCGLPQTPLNRRANQTCDKGNGGAFCSFRTCWYNHACAKCLSPQHLLILGEPRPLLLLPQRGSVKTREA